MHEGIVRSLVTVAVLTAVTACGGGQSVVTVKNVDVKTGNPSHAVTVTESGSSLLLPYLQRMTGPLRTDYPNIALAPSGGGSGKGVRDAISGAATMGGSDAYLSDGQAAQNPDLLNIPIAISAQAINYNLPGVSDLKLSGDVLARIYEGTITSWNDPAIARLNPGAALPSTTIVPVRRSDASGDTFIFTAFLTSTNTDWRDGPAYSTLVSWPSVPGEVTVSGNPAMAQACAKAPGCIAYVGVSAEQAALAAGLGEALLENRAGAFLKPSADSIASAVATLDPSSIPTDLRISLIYTLGPSAYPIVNLEYLMVRSLQPDADTALAVRSFLAWAIDTSKGSAAANLQAVGFAALPLALTPQVKATIARVTS